MTGHIDFAPGDTEQSSRIGVVCPHCGHMHRDDLHGLTEHDEDFDCDHCSKTFQARAEVSVTYYSTKD